MTTRSTPANAYADALDFPDTGCAAGGPSCLACPLARCVHDGVRPGGPPRQPERDALIVAALAGATVEDVAARFGLSRRSVWRIAQNAEAPAGRGSQRASRTGAAGLAR